MKSIQTKLTIIILLIFIVAMGLLGGLNYWKARQIISDNLVKEMTTLAILSANEVNDWIEGRKLEVAGIALAPVLQNGDSENLRTFLVQAAKTNGRFDSLGYIAPSGIAIDSNGASVNLGAREYFQKAMKGEAAVSEPVVSPATGSLVAVVAVPVKLDGKVTGVFFGSISLE